MKRSMNFTLILAASIATLLALPFLTGQGSGLTILCQVAVWTVFALSYNICLGQTGLLSFCHALFFGIGSFATAHAANAVMNGDMVYIPVWLMPLVGFAAGGALGLLLAAFLCRRIGVAFVMITLGLSQLFIYIASTLDSVFGGEGGVGIDRAYGGTFGQQLEVYWLIAAWLVISGTAMWLLTRTSFGKLARAVRENEVRARFLGQDVIRIRFVAITLSAAFAGLAGALQTINIEQVSSHLLGLKTSAFVLFMVVIGGARTFWGPVAGAVIISLLDKVLPNYTSGWLLYLGLTFCAVILFAPGGFVGIIKDRARKIRRSETTLGHVLARDAQMVLGVGLLVVGLVTVIEIASSISAGANYYESGELTLFGFDIDTGSVVPWAVGTVLALVGLIVVRHVTRVEEA